MLKEIRGRSVLAVGLAWLAMSSVVEAQTRKTFTLPDDLPGYEECFWSDHSDLHDFEFFKESHGKRLTTEEIAEIRRIWEESAAATHAELARIDADPVLSFERDVGTRLRKTPFFRDMEFTFDATQLPLVFVVQDPPVPADDHVAQVVSRHGPWMGALTQRFDEEFVQPLGLATRPGQQWSAIVVLASEDDHRRYVSSQRDWGPRNGQAYHDRDLQVLVTHAGPTADADARRHQLSAVLHEYVQMLLDAHRSPLSSGPALEWWSEGLAEAFAYLPADVEAADPAALAQPDPAAVSGVRRDIQDPQLGPVLVLPLPELIAVRDGADLVRRAEAVFGLLELPTDTEVKLPGVYQLKIAFARQTGALIQFLRTGDAEGRSRAALLQYVGLALTGEPGPTELQASIGDPVLLDQDFRTWLGVAPDAVAGPAAGDPEYDAYRAWLGEGLPASVADTVKAWERIPTRGHRRRLTLRVDRQNVSLARVAADLGLVWLAAHQAEDGHWSGAEFGAECGRLEQGPACGGAGAPMHDVGLTALALPPFLKAGHADQDSDYRPGVRRGLDWLVQGQADDGFLGDPQVPQATYDHLIATLALVEAVRCVDEYRYAPAAERALGWMYQHRNAGGAWRYMPKHPDMLVSPNDTSVTGWGLAVMLGLDGTDLPRDDDALADALAFVEDMTDPETGRTGYTQAGLRPPREVGREERWPAVLSESSTAAAVLFRQLADPERQRLGNAEAIDRGITLIARLPPLWSDRDRGRVDYYFWYYGTRALALAGGKPWDEWREGLERAILEHGLEAGDALGSWDPARDPWGHIGGRVYSTVMMTLAALTAASTD